MNEKCIPEHLDPFRFAEQGLSLSGIVNVSDMARLSQIILSEIGVASVELQFRIDDQGIPFLKGELQTQLTLQCQRCMEPFVYEIISRFALGIVKTLEEANKLPHCYEPALATSSSLAVRELIEDEIILNLPIISRHEPEDCKIKLPLADSAWEEAKDKNPFNVLQSLKDKK